MSVLTDNAKLLDEMLADVAGPPEREPGEFTAAELADQLGVSLRGMRERAENMVRSGQWTKRKVRGTSGRPILAYRKAK